MHWPSACRTQISATESAVAPSSHERQPTLIDEWRPFFHLEADAEIHFLLRVKRVHDRQKTGLRSWKKPSDNGDCVAERLAAR